MKAFFEEFSEASPNIVDTDVNDLGLYNRKTPNSTPTSHGSEVGIDPIAFGSTAVFLAPLKPKVAEGVFMR